MALLLKSDRNNRVRNVCPVSGKQDETEIYEDRDTTPVGTDIRHYNKHYDEFLSLNNLDLCRICDDDIEDIKETVYLLTWNPKDKTIGDDSDQQLKWNTMLCKVLKHLPRACSFFCIQPEVSPSNRLHVHGWVVIKDMVKWNKSVYKILFANGKPKLNKLHYWDSGLIYYKKDIGTPNDIQNYIHFVNLPFCHYNWDQCIKESFNHLKESNKKYIKETKKTKHQLDLTHFFPDLDILINHI